MKNIWLTKEQLADYLSIAIRTVDKKISEGYLPKPNTTLGDRSPRWNINVIDDFMNGESTQNQPTK